MVSIPLEVRTVAFLSISEAVPSQEDLKYLKRIRGAIMSLSSSLKSLLTVCVLAAFVASTVEESYKCVQCDQQCNEEKTCDSSHGCFSKKNEFNVTGLPPFTVWQKGCSSSKCEPRVFSATLGENYTYGYGYQCCQTEKCNKADFQVARKSSDPNGITCPACYNEKGATCQPTDLACKGEETKCLNFIGTVSDTVVLFGMGCATETACNLKDEETINNIKIRTYCVGSSNGSLQLTSIISSILTALFLLKVLI
ncbi:protein RoBo-1-like isoform X3 [Piliocolobus tephrosceles]|uniref:protein RoBo-1-like isoform X3 n=1 Tax=Piliocolobus tephrosceles TaxID=591936 RepID=UPI000C2AEF8C|nr:protein RoBo-1-like isoform X3 [Piliocolobus tephrosceles]